MSGFNDPIIGGDSTLIRTAIHSPDYVAGTSGWTINKDGSAEFRNITIPAGSGGATIYVQATAPASPNTGDLWFDSASGYQASQWSGSAWVAWSWGTASIGSGAITAALIAANTITAAQIAAGTITATQIASGAITAAKLAAGIVYAGIVDATTITGSTLALKDSAGNQRILITGSGSYPYFQIQNAYGAVIGLLSSRLDALLWYSDTGSATQGALIASIAGAAGHDNYAQNFVEGVELFGLSPLFGLSTKDAAEVTPGFVQATVNGSGTTRTAGIYISAPNLGGGTQGLEIDGESPDGTVPAVIQLGSGLVALTAGGVPPAAARTAYAGMQWLYGGQDGILGHVTLAGLALNLSGSQLAQIAPATINTTGIQSLGYMTVPGGDVVAGAEYEIRASGVASQGTTPSSAEFYVYWGSISGTQICTLTLPTITAGLSSFGWTLLGTVTWVSTTECEATLELHWHTASGVAGSVTWHTEAQTTALSTSSNENLSLAFSWGSVPSGTSLTCRRARFARLA